jgi:hypothetical protein
MRPTLLVAVLALASLSSLAATKPVPDMCMPDVNTGLLSFLHDQCGNPNAQLNNVMVCGKAIAASFEQPATSIGTGAHQVILLAAPAPDGTTVTIELVMNDALDGIVSAATADLVFAFGQAYITPSRDMRLDNIHPVAGIHDTHCATNSHMDDGWVVVNGAHYPTGSCSERPRHRSLGH